MIWTDAMVARMRSLQGEGLSASKTAKRLATDFDKTITRNMVIGKTYRLRRHRGAKRT